MSNEQKTPWTPGPWAAEMLYLADIPGNARIVITAAPISELHTAKKVAEAEFSLKPDGYHVSDRDEAEANARLIAAAPELVEALEIIMAHDSGKLPQYKLPNDITSPARALLARIKGEA